MCHRVASQGVLVLVSEFADEGCYSNIQTMMEHARLIPGDGIVSFHNVRTGNYTSHAQIEYSSQILLCEICSTCTCTGLSSLNLQHRTCEGIYYFE